MGLQLLTSSQRYDILHIHLGATQSATDKPDANADSANTFWDQ